MNNKKEALKMKVYNLVFDRDRGYDEYEGNEFEFLGVYKSEEAAIKARDEHIKNYHWSCGIDEKDYDIEVCEIIEVKLWGLSLDNIETAMLEKAAKEIQKELERRQKNE